MSVSEQANLERLFMGYWRERLHLPEQAPRLRRQLVERAAEHVVRESIGQRDIVGRVERAITAAEDLLRSLLDISRIDAGGITPEPAAIALSPFLSDLAETTRPMAEAKGLRLDVGPLPGMVESDAGLLRSVIQNFLSNAVRYTARGGVLVGVRRRGAHWRIDVIDTGVGIAESQIDEIFSEFVRLGTVEVEGLGLGLALVRRIVWLIGGRIEVRSAPGKGSRFSLYLPALDGIATPAPAALRGEPVAGRRLRVLSIDDDERIVEASGLLIERFGHEAIGAHDVAAALAAAEGIDAALVDYQLGGAENGLDLIDRLRARHPRLPVLLVTAESTPDLRTRAAAMGVDILSKPASPSAIEDFLAAVSVREIESE
mgnify:CR=1 FL=1